MRSLAWFSIARGVYHGSASILCQRTVVSAFKRFNTTVPNKFDSAYIRSKWYPKNMEAQPISIVKPTNEWNDNHLSAFNLHFFRVEQEEDWQVYLCPPEGLTPTAKALSEYKFTKEAFQAGEHEKPPHDQDPFQLRKFGDIMSEFHALSNAEAVVDDLAGVLLDVCNCDRVLMQAISKLTLVTKIGGTGGSAYTSIPDRMLIPRFALLEDSRFSLLVVEDKLKRGYVEPQLAGEMLAVAIHNYQYLNTDTTVFGMVIKGTEVSLYRADFPVAYLESVINERQPKGHIVVFKYSGGTGRGIDVTDCGPKRTLVLQVLCSIVSFCAKEIVPYAAQHSAVVPPYTSARLSLLQDFTK